MSVFYAIFAASLDLAWSLLELYFWILIIGAVLSWLIAFGVVNTSNRVVQVISDICYRLTEPVLKYVRRFVPAINGVDLSPLVVIFAIFFLQSFLRHLAVG